MYRLYHQYFALITDFIHMKNTYVFFQTTQDYDLMKLAVFFNPSLHLLEEVTKTGNREGATSNEHRERENDNWEQNLS